MPLALKLRDEENERINNILKRLIGLDYVPENDNAAIDVLLSGIGLDFKKLLELSPEALVLHLRESNFDWENAERFGDFLMVLSGKVTEQTLGLKAKAIAVYNYIQTESKTFSFTISHKITSAKK